jgi:chromosome segregation ATPase
MFDFLKKKKDGESSEDSSENPTEETPEKKIEIAPVELSDKASSDVIKLKTEIEKLKAGQEAFKEVRSSFSERFTRTSEQIGELRSMILERDRTIQEVELKAVKSSDLVASVQPEKLMTEVQKQEVRIEALKANLEGNESIMNRIMEELRETRKKIEFFRGVEEIIKLSEEVKAELIEIKKVEGRINTQTDKVQTIYAEMRTRIQDLDAFKTQTMDAKASIEQNAKDIEFVKSKITNLAEKSELDKLVTKLQGYINSLSEIQKKTSFSKDIDQLKIIMEGIK